MSVSPSRCVDDDPRLQQERQVTRGGLYQKKMKNKHSLFPHLLLEVLVLTGSGPLEEVWLLLQRETEAGNGKRVIREIIKSDKYICNRDCK